MIELAGRRVVGPLRQDREAGFVARFALLVTAVLAVAWLLSLTHPTGLTAYVIPASGAALIGLAYLRRPAEATLALALLVLFYDTLALWIGPHFKQVDELSVGLMFLIAFVRVGRSWRQWFWLPREGALALAFLMGIVSSLSAGVPLDVWAPAVVLLGKAIAFFYVVLWSRYRDWELRAGMGIVLGIGAVVLALGFVELINPSAFQHALGLNEYIRTRGESAVVKSLFVHPALYGWFTAFVALFLYAKFQVTRRWVWLAGALLASLGPFLSARRRAILALATGLIAAIAEGRRHVPSFRALARSWTPAAAGMLLLTIVFFPALISLYQLTIDRYVPGATPSPAPSGYQPSPGPSIVPGIGEDENPQARIALYVGSLKVARDYFPLGGGLGRYGSWMSRVHYSPLYKEYGLSGVRGLRPNNPRSATDTFWPQILGELGVIGLLGYAGFLGALGLMLWREAARDDGPTLAVLRMGAGMIFAQAIVESVASSMFHSPPRVYLFYLVVGAVASFSWRRRADLADAGLADAGLADAG